MFRRFKRLTAIALCLVGATSVALAPPAGASTKQCTGAVSGYCIHVYGVGLHVDAVSFTTYLPPRSSEEAVFYYTFNGKVIHSTGEYYYHNQSYIHIQTYTSRLWDANRYFKAGKLCAFSEDNPGHHYDSPTVCANIHA